MVVKHFSRLDASSSKCNMIGKYPAKKVQNVRWKFYQSIVSFDKYSERRFMLGCFENVLSWCRLGRKSVICR